MGKVSIGTKEAGSESRAGVMTEEWTVKGGVCIGVSDAREGTGVPGQDFGRLAGGFMFVSVYCVALLCVA